MAITENSYFNSIINKLLIIFDVVMLESSLYSPLTRDIQIGEVLAVPKMYYNNTKFVR